MEIFHAFGIDWKLITIQGINFAVVLFVLHRYAYKPIMALIAKRQAVIAEGIQNAEDATKEKEQIALDRELTLQTAREEGGKISDGLRKQGIAEEREIVRVAQEKSNTILADARELAEKESAHILREAEREIARMAVLGAEKILRNGQKA